MSTLLIPCAGRNFINNQPRWTLKLSDSDILLTKCLDEIGYENYEKVVVIILKEDINLVDINKLYQRYNNVEFCVLEEKTNGPADTIAIAIEKMKIHGVIQVKDIDILFNCPKIYNGNFISGIHLENYESDIKNIKNKSYLVRNEQNVVMDIIEKKIKSDIISIGLYGFSNALDYMNAYKTLKRNFDDREVLYVSHIISYLIGVEGKVFDFVEISNYESLETFKDYEKFIRSRGMYLIDATSIKIIEYVNEMKIMSLKGAKFIFIGLCDESDLKLLKDNNINFDIIDNKNYNCIRLISTEDEIKDVLFNAI